MEADSVAGPTAEVDPLNLLLEMELPLSVCFGGTRLRLHEILHLRPGSVVTLDQEAGEQVDIIINDRVVARGEVVIVDGNYAVRVQHIATESQRRVSAELGVRRAMLDRNASATPVPD